MLSYEGEKMSKSLGNLVLVRDLLRTYPGDAIRHYLASRHYRSEVHFAESDLARSADAAALLRRACLRAEELAPADPAMADDAALDPRVAEHRRQFLEAMDDDLDTPRAMAELDDLASLALGADNAASRSPRAGWSASSGARIVGLRLHPYRPPRPGPGMTGAPPDDDLVPVSVRLGQVVPPEDPEDWTRPLTWIAALGMLAGPIAAAAWFLLVGPTEPYPPTLGTYLVAMLLAAGAATGAARSAASRPSPPSARACSPHWYVVILGVVTAGERQVGSACRRLPTPSLRRSRDCSRRGCRDRWDGPRAQPLGRAGSPRPRCPAASARDRRRDPDGAHGGRRLSRRPGPGAGRATSEPRAVGEERGSEGPAAGRPRGSVGEAASARDLRRVGRLTPQDDGFPPSRRDPAPE